MPDLRALPGLAVRAVAYEWSLYVSLARWVTRRPVTTSPDDEVVGCARDASPVLWLWIFASAAEVPIVHLLVPWDGARDVLLVLSVWGLLWMVGLLASLRVHPHLAGPVGLRVRSGARTDLLVPWASVAGVRVERRDLPSSIRAVHLRETGTGAALDVGVAGEVNVSLALHAPLAVALRSGPVDVVAVSLLVDDPRAFVAQVRRRTAGARSAS